MTLGEDISRRVRNVTREVRTAIAAECGTRVLPVYENYPVGTYFESVARSVEIAWAFACGTPFDPTEVQTCLEEVRIVVDFYREEGIDVLAQATTVVLRILECLIGDDAESLRAVGRALVSTIDTAVSAEAMANVGTLNEPEKDMARDEEKAWQERAIEVANAWQGAPKRTMFDSISIKPPAWLVDWLKRSER